MAIFCDTGFYFALLFTRDDHHLRAKKIIYDLADGKHGKIYTSDYVLDESLTLINVRTHGQRVDLLSIMASLFIGNDPIAHLLNIKFEMLKEIIDLQQKYTSLKRILSFTDSSNIYLCKKYEIEKILSFDNNFDRILLTIN